MALLVIGVQPTERGTAPHFYPATEVRNYLTALLSVFLPPLQPTANMDTGYTRNNFSVIHRVLNIQELVCIIFRFLHPRCMDSYFDPKVRKERLFTLASLARTCKSFKSPAYIVLYEEQHGLTAFLPMLEELVKCFLGSSQIDTDLTSYRIRTLYYCDHSDFKLDVSKD